MLEPAVPGNRVQEFRGSRFRHTRCFLLQPGFSLTGPYNGGTHRHCELPLTRYRDRLETGQVVVEPQQRRVTLEAATKLTAHFNLPIAPNHVDWDILCTFGGRTEEFLTYYETCASLTED